MKSFLKQLLGTQTTKAITTVLIDPEIRVFIDELMQEVTANRDGYYAVKLSDSPKYKALKKKPASFKKKVIFALIHYKNVEYSGKNSAWGTSYYWVGDILTKLLSLSIRAADLHFSQEELVKIIEGFIATKKGYFLVSDWPFIPLLSKMEKYVQEHGLSPEIEKGLALITKKIANRREVYADEVKILDRIRQIKQGPTEFAIDQRDALGKAIVSTAKSFSGKKQDIFIALLQHFAKGASKSSPAKIWLKHTDDKIKEIGEGMIITSYLGWISIVTDVLKNIHRDKSYEFRFVSDSNLQLLRAAVWSASGINDDHLNQAIEELGLWSFKKLPSYGSVSAKLGNATIYTFSQLPYQDGISRLTKFRMKIKYPSVQTLIEKAIMRVAEAEGKTMDQIEELAVQDFGLNNEYEIIQKLGTYKGIVTIKNSTTVSLLWENEQGKQIKSIPKAIKDTYPEELKALKKQVKDIQSSLAAQRSRIEKIFVGKRQWKFSDWKSLYLDHPLLAFFGTKLIWNFKLADTTIQAIYHNNQFINPDGEVTQDVHRSEVSLWHPATAAITEVASWRNWLMTHQIRQPFKQAHREIYLVTDAELTTNSYSNRFAAHILRQHIFNALCRERGWRYQIQGQWDSYNTPTIKIPAWNYRVEFWVEGIHGSANDMGIFNYLQTDQVRFYNKEEQVNMEDVPTIVFSEMMRDVDLFVGVTSIGADPNWQDGGQEGYQQYWTDYSFGDLATSGIERKKLLETLIPKLKIKDQCTFEGNFLVVKGAIRTYKIHVGSGNILMKPNDQYLCIVANRSKKSESIFLPFEGDTMLSMILSKALLLAEDKKITDSTILSQIGR
ncbi:DUF4132 domain-containing protein [uncultured Aquimarina sp.]|uniref:DUF4132 domain-containing protein n=1 Tax=uncultured Aquimarina sp. TaxID=575652 RepID=UPI002630EC0F|nr:DUF4132 domain-containing protein [uncultured Aquimarina sp.]